MSASFVDVLGNLLTQRVDRLEPHFFSKSPLEGQIDLHSVEFPREIDDVGLGDQLSTIPEGGPEAHIGHDRQELLRPFHTRFETPKMTEIDPGRRQDLGLGSEIGGGKTERPSASITLNHLSSSTKGPPEKQRRLLHIALSQQFPDSRRIHIATLDLDLGHHRHRETEMGPALGEHAHRALSIATEMEVVTDIDLDGPNALMDVMSDESLRTDLREFAVEGLGDHNIESELFKRLDLLFERIEQS
jgi:hypothetical protein